jgi:hypothetical protein
VRGVTRRPRKVITPRPGRKDCCPLTGGDASPTPASSAAVVAYWRRASATAQLRLSPSACPGNLQ